MIKLRKRISSFAFLNVVQFLGALNDNIFKAVIVFLLIGLFGKGDVNIIMVTSGAAFILPFLLFSIPAGTLSDRYSKRNITVATKIIEVVVMSLGIIAFGHRSPWATYLVLFLMATQSAIFGPSKYGIVPELVKPERIAPSNGILTALTVIATITGTFMASALTEWTDHNYVFIASFCVVISVLGLLAALSIGYTKPAGSTRKIKINFAGEAWRVLKRTRTQGYLFAALTGGAYFYLVGAFMQLNIIPFSIQSLGLSAEHGNYLFAVAALGIAVGAMVAGKVSGEEVELGLCPIAGIGMGFMTMMAYPFQHMLWPMVGIIFSIGAFGGIFLVPFDSYLQAASPDSERGENVAANNFLSFVGVSIATLLLFLFGNVLNMSAAQGFLAIGILTLIVSTSLTWRLSDTFVRLLSRYVYRTRKEYSIIGGDALPLKKPVLFLCLVQKWSLGLIVMTTLQQRYMRFIVQRPAKISLPARWLSRLAKVAFYDRNPAEAAFLAERWLQRGYDLTIIPLDAEKDGTLDLCNQLIAGRDIAVATAMISPKTIQIKQHRP